MVLQKPNSNYSQEVLAAIDNMPIKELFIKLEVLNWQEEPIKEIQGVLTGGNISINGKSAVRRTCSLNFITVDNTIEDYIQLDKKFKLHIGLKNHLPIKYNYLGDVLWFKQGIFVFTKASFTHNASNITVSVTAQDKMCLLNGTCGGTIADFVVFNEIEMTVQDRRNELQAKQKNGTITDEENRELALLQGSGYEEDDIVYIPVLIYTLIQECVNHYGGEKLQNIRIDDVPLEAKQLLEYRGNRPMYLAINDEGLEPHYLGSISFNLEEAKEWDYGYEVCNAGDLIGYEITAFTWPGELSMSPGTTVTAVLDKIKGILGNFEYFYDIDGIFHFQEIKNYLNNSYVPLSETDYNSYQADFNAKEIIYSFKDNPTLITAYSNSPKYENIKNDFVVWGERKNVNGSTTKIRYHLAIDGKPNPEKGDWREAIYLQTREATDEEGLNFYKKELDAEWRNLYNPKNKDWEDTETGTYWNPNVNNNPATLNYFLDFIDEDSIYGKWSVNAIGRRTIVKDDKDCVAIMNKRIPDYIFTYSKSECDRLAAEGYSNAFLIDSSFREYFSIAANRKTCLDTIREILYTNLSLNETINITALPIYWLEPNYLIEVEDKKSRIYGKYEINSISIPLTHNGTMSLQCSRVTNKI